LDKTNNNLGNASNHFKKADTATVAKKNLNKLKS